MRILPDTHALIWWLNNSPKLPARVRDLMNDDSTPFIFSAAAVWEVRVKQAAEKLGAVEDFDVLEDAGVVLLPITHEHATVAAALPLHHRDPFDRMLIAQAQLEDAVVLTADPAFAAYDVKVVW
jgi:PIN domain nuclease of toxin-antitoxin system